MTEKPVEALKQIHEAEVRAEEIVNSARAEGRSILKKAGVKAEEIMKGTREEWKKVFIQRLKDEISPLEEEIQARFLKEREEIRKAGSRKREGMDEIVKRLVQMVLP